ALLLVGGLAAVQPWGLDWVQATADLLRDPFVLLDLTLLTLLSTALAFHWMATYQPRVPASRAALVFLLEPVFGAIFSVAWGHDMLTFPLMLGGCLLLGGNLLVELPGWLRSRRVDECLPDRTVTPPTDLAPAENACSFGPVERRRPDLPAEVRAEAPGSADDGRCYCWPARLRSPTGLRTGCSATGADWVFAILSGGGADVVQRHGGSKLVEEQAGAAP